jgi:hypothetical protein
VKALILALALIASVGQATAHEWYGGKNNMYGGSCCGGADCANVALESVREVKGGWIVTLTKDQMQHIMPAIIGSMATQYGGGENMAFKHLRWGISEFVPYREGMPAQDGAFSVCLKSYPAQMGSASGPLRWINCFFYPSNT